MTVGVDILLSYFFLGLGTNFVACLFQVLPAFVAYITKAGASKGNGVLVSLRVVFGLLTTFLTLSLILDNLSKLTILSYGTKLGYLNKHHIYY